MSEGARGSFRLLVVEGDPVIAADICKALSTVGHVVTVALRGNAAVSCCMTHDFDAMILDRTLPDTTDIVVIAELIRLGCCIPALVLGAKGRERDRIEALYAGG